MSSLVASMSALSDGETRDSRTVGGGRYLQPIDELDLIVLRSLVLLICLRCLEIWIPLLEDIGGKPNCVISWMENLCLDSP